MLIIQVICINLPEKNVINLLGLRLTHINKIIQKKLIIIITTNIQF